MVFLASVKSQGSERTLNSGEIGHGATKNPCRGDTGLESVVGKTDSDGQGKAVARCDFSLRTPH